METQYPRAESQQDQGTNDDRGHVLHSRRPLGKKTGGRTPVCNSILTTESNKVEVSGGVCGESGSRMYGRWEEDGGGRLTIGLL